MSKVIIRNKETVRTIYKDRPKTYVDEQRPRKNNDLSGLDKFFGGLFVAFGWIVILAVFYFIGNSLPK